MFQMEHNTEIQCYIHSYSTLTHIRNTTKTQTLSHVHEAYNELVVVGIMNNGKPFTHTFYSIAFTKPQVMPFIYIPLCELLIYT